MKLSKAQREKRKGIASLGASIGDFEQWVIDEQRKEKDRKAKKGSAALSLT